MILSHLILVKNAASCMRFPLLAEELLLRGVRGPLRLFPIPPTPGGAEHPRHPHRACISGLCLRSWFWCLLRPPSCTGPCLVTRICGFGPSSPVHPLLAGPNIQSPVQTCPIWLLHVLPFAHPTLPGGPVHSCSHLSAPQ